MADTARELRGLILSAVELRQLHPSWSQAMIEDYLNIFNNLTKLADITDTKQNASLSVRRVTTSPFQIASEDEIFADSDTGPITVRLPPGSNGRHLRIHNTGAAGNTVSIVPDGTDLLFGVNATEPLYDGEVFIITFETNSGWD